MHADTPILQRQQAVVVDRVVIFTDVQIWDFRWGASFRVPRASSVVRSSTLPKRAFESSLAHPEATSGVRCSRRRPTEATSTWTSKWSHAPGSNQASKRAERRSLTLRRPYPVTKRLCPENEV